LEITIEESVIIILKHKQIRSQDEHFVRKVLQNILKTVAMLEKFQRFQRLALEVKVETILITNLKKDLKISLTEIQAFMTNIVIQFILTFKELIWKLRCEQVILWKRERGISRTDKITSKDNINPFSNKVKDSKNPFSNKVKDDKYKCTGISNRQTEIHNNFHISISTLPTLQTRKID
jgi:hypothetical protein